jgi:ribosomal protein L3 glutamine methyltransferase
VTIPKSLDALSTIRDFIRWGSIEFNKHELTFGHGFATAYDEAKYLIMHRLALPIERSEDCLDRVLSDAERDQVMEIFQQRIDSRQPAAYLTRESWFCGLKFYVDQRVLVPRSPIAELIADRFEPWIDSSRINSILDLCTGSACIAIASQYLFKHARVFASDISANALEVASINCREHGLSEQLTLYQSDLFGTIPPQQFDVIVSNPPYVDAEDMATLSDEFKFEPRIGLAAGDNGLAMVDRILLDAGEYLAERGVLFIEVGNSQQAMMDKYLFLPMTWIDFEYGGSGVCCIYHEDLKHQQSKIDQANLLEDNT